MQGGAAVARRRVDAEVPHEEGMVILDQGIRRHSNKVKGKRPATQSMVQAEGRRRVARGFLLLITYCQGGIDNVQLFLRLLEPQLSLPRAELPWGR